MATEQSVLRVGAARAVITPPVGVSLAGSYSDRRAVSVRDELYARAFVVDGATGGTAEGNGVQGGSHSIAIVSCDLIGMRASTVAGARRLIQERCGLPPERVLIAATHNHSGPLTRELVAGGLAGEPDEPYLAYLERQIASAVQVAFWRRSPARLRLTLGEAHGISFNRRFRMREGPVRTNPGKQNPDIVQTAGPLDPRVWTLAALPAGDGYPTEGAEAVPPNVGLLGLLVNFALHPAIVGGTVIGGDFPHFLETGVQRLLGPSAAGVAGAPLLAAQSTTNAPAAGTAPRLGADAPVVVLANAPCGDINHIDVSHAQRQGGFAEAARVGTILAAEVAQSACRLRPDLELTGAEGSGAVCGARRRVELRLRRPTPEQVTWAREAARGRMSMVPNGGLEVVEAHRIIALADGWTGETYTTEVQALAIGDDLAVVGLPGEVFADLGLDLRSRSPFKHTLVLGLANEAIGYVPTRQAYDEGGYEPTASRLQPGSGEHLVAEALDLLSELRR